MVKQETLNTLRQLIFDAFMEAAPYLQHLEWVKNTCFECLNKVKNLEQLKTLLEEKVRKEEDKFKQVDLKIFMVYFCKEWRKHFGYEP